jgi:hypothetical protein
MAQDKNNKTTRRDRLRQFRDGIQKHVLPTYPSIVVGGVSHAVTDILKAIDADIATSDAAEQGHAAWLQQVEEERTSHAALDPIISGTKQFVRLTFGNTDAQQALLADFGMTPHKKRAPKPKTQVAAAQKAKTTRQVLHTMGSKQKKEALAQASAGGASGPAAAQPAPAGNPPGGGGTTTPAKQ